MNFRNKNLVVTEVHGYMDRGLFKYKYKLSRKEGLYCQEIKNKALSGAAFDGKILAVQGQTVRMHLNIDSEQVTTKAHWFPFAPPTGNMMYCMPKVGTSARLYFPNSDPENAEVTGSVRDNGSSCAKTGNPNNRYFGTEHGSELAMLLEKMSISGSEKNLHMSMKNDTGLDFTSHKKIVLNAAEGVYFKTPKKIIINGENNKCTKDLFTSSPDGKEGIFKQFTNLYPNLNIHVSTYSEAVPGVGHGALSFDLQNGVVTNLVKK